MKQWWVAKQLGVHRKTVSRWINRHVRTTTNELAEALAAQIAAATSHAPGATRSKPALSPSKVPVASRSLRRI
jgi:DNA-binding LacI/PurR family transcriptional regulator